MSADVLRFTILGCGSSGGVPRIGGENGEGIWGACDPANPRNRRRRCSLLGARVGAQGVTRVLIDTGPDFRQQMIDARVKTLDTVLYTHDHADHMHGLDDLRQIVFNTRRKLNVWADKATGETLMARFGYAFETPPGSPYPPILRLKSIEQQHFDPATPIVVEGEGGPIEATPFEATHGSAPALGFRIGGLAYLPDANIMPEETWPALQGLDIFIVDALRYTEHPTHANVETALEWIERAHPKRAVLTNMHVDIDYATIAAEMPAHIVPAFDGMTLELPVR